MSIATFADDLTTSLGNEDAFTIAIAKVEAASAADAKKVANLFTGAPLSIIRSKVEAIALIKTRHRNLMDARAKAAFNQGTTVC